MTVVTKRVVIEIEYEDSQTDAPCDWDWDLGVSFDQERGATRDEWPHNVYARYIREVES